MGNENRDEKLAKARERMVSNDLRRRGINDERIIKAMSEVRREAFVGDAYVEQAYSDGPLPIGCGQTISQPYIVGLMTQELWVDCDCEVLEIGTGSGYQTAILSRLAKKVYTVERVGQLSEGAQAVLGRMGAENVEFCVSDGSGGWPEKRTFDRIIITAAVPEIPRVVTEQLKDGGVIVAPVGLELQQLVVGEKHGSKIIERTVCDVRFVRLIGEYGFEQ